MLGLWELDIIVIAVCLPVIVGFWSMRFTPLTDLFNEIFSRNGLGMTYEIMSGIIFCYCHLDFRRSQNNNGNDL
jgi:hypothetical protein